MQTRTKFLVWLALLFLLAGLACNPLAALNPVETPAVTTSTGKTELATQTASPSITERTVKVDALYFTGGATASGGTSTVQVKVRPAAQPGQLRVGFFEEEVGGTGAQWHASGWEAVLLGSMLRGVDPTDYEFSFSVGGRIDGPSAGGLMTVGVLAALRGDTPRTDATMTGTINPDGTIGPVGGIPHKVEGAANKGKKLVLVPVGERYSLDYNKKRAVDVIEVGRNLGVEVREVSNIYDAYEQIVGKPLPRPSVSMSTPQFPARAFDRLKAKTKEWYSRYEKERSRFGAFSSSIRKYLGDSLQYADQSASMADKDLAQGLAGLAYFDAFDAARTMRKANFTGAMIERYYGAKGLEATLSYLQSAQTVQSELSAVTDQLQTLDPKTVSDVLALFDAYSELGAAQGLILLADSRVGYIANNASSYSKDELLLELLTVAEYYTEASDYVQLARDAIDIEMGFGATPAPQSEKVLRVAEALRRAAEANLALFESTIVDEQAKQLGIRSDVMKSMLLAKDTDYRIAVVSGTGMRIMSQRLGEGPKSAAMIFGNSQNIFALSSTLIAKYYSLEARLDKDLAVTSFGNDKALGEMLDFADQRAKELINLCGDDVPVPAILYYENARAYRLGSAGEQLVALNYYWQASALAQASAFMSGKLSSK